jgi:large subunit ribosomal protein L22
MRVKSGREGADVPGLSVHEREGTRAVLRHSHAPANKVRQVLDLIRGRDVAMATEILANGDRDAATVVGKVLASAVANAVHNDGLAAEELYVSACYADEGSTLKRWRPRARGRASRIRKRTSHITVIVSRMPDERIARRRAKQSAGGSQRSRRVAGSRRRQQAAAAPDTAGSTARGTETEELSEQMDELAEADADTGEASVEEAIDEAGDETVEEAAAEAVEETDAEDTEDDSTEEKGE